MNFYHTVAVLTSDHSQNKAFHSLIINRILKDILTTIIPKLMI